VGIAYAGSASVATLLYLTYQQSGVGVLMAGVPIIGLLMATMHMYLRQQEADEAMRKSRVEAVEREQEQAQRHMAELQRSEQRFHSAFTHAFIGMTLLRPDGRILQANRAWRSLLGVGDEDLSPRSFSDFVCAEDVRGQEEELTEWVQRVPLAVVTAGASGALLYVNGDRFEVKPRPARDEVDETGAGDVFATTFLIYYHRDGDPWAAAEAAACAASLSVEGEGWSTVPDTATLEAALKEYRARL